MSHRIRRDTEEVGKMQVIDTDLLSTPTGVFTVGIMSRIQKKDGEEVTVEVMPKATA